VRRILLLTKFKKPWNNGHYMARALEEMGWKVDRIDTPSQLHMLHETVKSGNMPDLALATKADGMTPEMVRGLQEKGCPFVIWFPDPVPPPEHMVKIGRISDFFFTMSQGRIKDYLAAGIPRVEWLTQAVHPDFFPVRELTPEQKLYYGCDVGFVGNLGTLPQYLPRRQMLEHVIKAGFSLKWWGPRPSRKIKDIPFLFSKVCRSYGGRFVYLDTFSMAARGCKVFLSQDSYPDIRLSMSVKIYTAMCCGAFYMCRRVNGIEELFTPGEDIEVFDTYQEMTEKIRYYIDHPDERRRIAEAGRNRVLSLHTYHVRFATMFDILRANGILSA